MALRKLSQSLKTGVINMATITLTSNNDNSTTLTQNGVVSMWGNTYDGAAGVDTIMGGESYSSITGARTGFYTVSANSDGVVTLTSTSGGNKTIKFVNFEKFNFNGTIINLGTSAADTIAGGTGSDKFLFGLGGNDTITGGGGTDTVIMQGNKADYTVTQSGTTYTIVDNVAGRDGTDTLTGITNVQFRDTTAAITTLVTVTPPPPPPPPPPPVTPVQIDGDANANTLTGNSVSNTINGLGGNDTITASGGTDTMNGGAGDDTYNINDAGGHVVVENANEGTDTVNSAVTYTLTANVENLVLTGSAAINGTGNALNNRLTGNSASNTLTGGGGTDTAVYSGVLANYTIAATDATHATVTIGGVTDTLSGITNIEIGGTTYAVSSFVPVVPQPVINGTAGADNLTGNNLDNTINGLGGNDSLTASGGTDTLNGGAGDDTYNVSGANGIVVENANEGIDTVNIDVTHTLGANVENLVLTGSAAINGTGNALDNKITGNSGNNTLTGGGGTDTAIYNGARANFTVVANDATHATITGAGFGSDTLSGITYIQFANNDIAMVSSFLPVNPGDPVEITGDGNDNALTGNSQNNTINGLGGNDTLTASIGTDTLVGGSGDDTYVINTSGNTVTEAANEGTDTVKSMVDFTLGANVEKLELTGTGAINGTGNELANTITGNSGNNTLDGGTGDDALTGGAGDDIHVVDAAGDVVTENADEGTDTIQSSVTIAALAANVENLVLTGTAAVDGTGNALANAITGNAGANLLSGAGGDDTIDGGDGLDTLVLAGVMADYEFTSLGATQVKVVDKTAGRDGTDTITNVESIKFSDNSIVAVADLFAPTGPVDQTLTGTDGNDSLTGGAGNDTLNGGGGMDTLNGADGTDMLTGGTGDDAIDGGAGNDTAYFMGVLANYKITSIDATTVKIEDQTAGRDGVDTVTNVEHFTFSGNTLTLAELIASIDPGPGPGPGSGGGTGDDDSLTGDADDNTIEGLAGDDMLDGGKGADSLKGGEGDDVYVVDNAGDKAIEMADDGIDSVKASISFKLGLNLEHLTLTGALAINGTGNALANSILGNNAANKLSGGSGKDKMQGAGGKDYLDGGKDADMLYGGFGDDIYVIDNAGDKAIESLNSGKDLVKSSIGFHLGANVENLTLTGAGATNGYGNALANVITGNGAANRITGGAGRDSLTGGNGKDVFDFNAFKETGKTATTRDTITDFNHLLDRIDLSTIDANGQDAGNGQFNYIGWHGFSGRGAEVNFAVSGKNTVLSGDIDGDRVADFQITLIGLKDLATADFIL